MSAIDPVLNQTLWWYLLGAFSGWLLWLLIDRLFWRDGLTADELEDSDPARLREALTETRREESLLRGELEREQEESQRLVAATRELRSRLEGQDQMVATLEAALDAARLGSRAPGVRTDNLTGAAAGAGTSALQPANPADKPEQISAGSEAGRGVLPPSDDGGEQALRDLLDQPDLDADLNDLLGGDEDLFGAPTEILTRPGGNRSGPNTLSQVSGYNSGPLSDDELDNLLDADTGTLLNTKLRTSSPDTDISPPSDPDSAASDLGGHTLTMLDRLKGAESEHPGNAGRTQRRLAGEDTDESPDSRLRPAQSRSLVNRLRNAFGSKSSDRSG